jgi:iron complex outermembrane recepter protein
MIKKQVVAVFAIAAAMGQPAFGQRTDDNAVTQSDDAFGKSVGDEQIGIYNSDDVRGFSPVAAGNLRIEGLYFDQQVGPTERIVEGNTIHVGISAQGYPFPAPTGIADYTLRKPGAEALASVALNYGPFGGYSAEFDTQLPLDGERLGLVGGAGFYRERNPFHGSPKFLSMALGARYAPAAGIEIIPFWSQIRVRNDESQSLIFTNGDFLPKRVRRDVFLGQKWADFSSNFTNYGVVAKAKPIGIDVSLGVFRSINDVREDHIELLFDVDQDGRVGRRGVIAIAGDKYASTSGELRLSKHFDEGPRRHTLIASIRARKQDRRYGGEDFLDLGPSQIGIQDFKPEPVASFGAKTTDEVKQYTFGVAYQARWRNLGELSVGLQKTDYTKDVGGLPPSKDKPWLLSATAAIYLTKDLALYGGYSKGLEESPVAPSNAINLNEAPPAILTEQKEAGIRWRISDGVTMVLGVFDIIKPYFNLDGSNRFRQLGDVRHRGVEISIAGQIAPGLSLVAGNVLLDADVSGEEVRVGLIGKKPVGTFVRHTVVALDYNLPWHKPLSLTANFEGTSKRTANAANTLVIPTRAVMTLGARYKFRLGKVPALLRASVGNVTNTFGWNVGESGFFVPNGSRRYSLSLAADL